MVDQLKGHQLIRPFIKPCQPSHGGLRPIRQREKLLRSVEEDPSELVFLTECPLPLHAPTVEQQVIFLIDTWQAILPASTKIALATQVQ